jgi:hypothetical protein
MHGTHCGGHLRVHGLGRHWRSNACFRPTADMVKDMEMKNRLDSVQLPPRGKAPFGTHVS